MAIPVSRRALPWVLCLALLSGVSLVAPAESAVAAVAVARAEPTTSVADEPTKYYIVGYTGTTEREFLFQIAARTLGDGRRYMEIFELNRGRLQPDGQRLEDPLVLQPGWILVLPPDADGPGVQVGQPPVFGSASGEAPLTSTASAPVTTGQDGALRTVAFILVVAILAVALHLLRRGQRIELPEPVRAAVRTRLRPRPSLRQRGRERLGIVSERMAPERDSALVPTAVLPATRRTVPASLAPAPPIVEPDTPVGTPSGTTPVPADPTRTRVELSLRAGQDRLTVRLIGARLDVGGALLNSAEAAGRRAVGAVVRIGEGAEAVWLDLAASPDVIRINGTRAGVRRQAEVIGRQLAQSGIPTVVVGDVPGVTDVARLSVATLHELVDGTGQPPLLVAFLGELAAPDVPVLHELVARRRPRVIPVAIGPGPRSRWSIDVA